jgi:hypothetical protein
LRNTTCQKNVSVIEIQSPFQFLGFGMDPFAFCAYDTFWGFAFQNSKGENQQKNCATQIFLSFH